MVMLAGLCSAPESAAETEPRFPLSPHKPIYLLPLTYDRADHPDRQRREFKFQISLKKRFFDWMPLYFGLTQLSFQQIYDSKRSRPFRESNFNPEVFFDVPPWEAGGHSTAFRLGVEHESNGQSGALSRSWDRAYVMGTLRGPKLGAAAVSLKLWQRFPERRKRDPEDTAGDDNPDIERFMGRFELRGRWGFNKDHAALPTHGLSGMYRKGSRDKGGTYQLDYIYQPPIFNAGVYLHLHYFYGYGESLIDYNRRVNKVGVGFTLR